MEYTLTDIVGTGLACGLFLFIFVAPGYLAGWFFNFWEFRGRTWMARLGMGLILSVALSPIAGFLLYRLASVTVALFIFGLAGLFCAIVVFRDWPGLRVSPFESGSYARIAWWLGFGWGLLAMLSLVDLQIGNRLYESVIAGDHTTRALVTDAITRTGVPPQNPGYYPGHPVPLTYLYYFWYILTSMVDLVGGSWVTPQTAMIASVIWCGFILMALVAVYTRLRNVTDSVRSWRLSLIGIGLLGVSGLDVLPAGFIMYASRLSTGSVMPSSGDMEHWNQQITAWLGGLLWVPHHLAAFVACMAGLLLLEGAGRSSRLRTHLGGLLVAGLGFASAVGLSIWVTLVFAVFWGVSILAQFFRKDGRLAWWMLAVGVVAGIAVSPFLLDLIQNPTGGGGGGFPLSFEVRRFVFTLSFENILSPVFMSVLNLLVLPINYFLELGFFLAAGWLWWAKFGRAGWKNNRFYLAELFLLLVTIPLVTFLRSSVLENDFGWRGWLFGQFVLLVWGAEVLLALRESWGSIRGQMLGVSWNARNSRRLLVPLLILGAVTTLFDLGLLRFWPILIDNNITAFPVEISPDAHLGERTYAARQAYDFIRDKTSSDWIVQYNPIRKLDHPAGLYGSRQMVIADMSIYGVAPDTVNEYREEIGALFGPESASGWKNIDLLCRKYGIDLLIINDTDNLWKSLPILTRQRSALYRNLYYALFQCDP